MKWKKRIGLNKNAPLEKLLPFVFLIGTSTALQNVKLTIKKCCPKGQELSSTLMCVNTTGDLNNNKVEVTGEKATHTADDPSKNFNDSSAENHSSFPELLPWFPFASLIDPQALQEITHPEHIRHFLKEARFQYGVRPDCLKEEKDWSCFTAGYSKQFHLFLYPQQGIRLYVSRKSSYQDQKCFKIDDRDCGFLKIGQSENCSERSDWSTSWLNDAENPTTFPSEDFCVDKGPGDSFLAEYCPCRTVPCVQKCCQDSQIYDNEKRKCVSNSTFGFWRPSLENGSLPDNYYLLISSIPAKCINGRWLKWPQRVELRYKKNCRIPQNREERNKFYFLSDGSLKMKKSKRKIPAWSYCGDHMVYNSTDFVENNILVCLDGETSLQKFRVYGILFVFGGFVLLVTIAISLYLPELRSSVYNKVIICHNVSLMLSDFIWGSTYLLPYVTQNLCMFLSLAIQCTFLASFFWINVMCLDISFGMRRLKSPTEAIDENKKFYYYLVYACGAPIIITSITAAMEFIPSLPPQFIRPGFGCSSCGFDPDSPSILIYVYGPMMTIILFNLIFFFMTVIQIIKVQKETSILGNQTSSANNIRQRKKRLVIFGKLFLLMGLSWIMEIVGWLVGGDDYYWYFPDFINILRSVFIFVMIICKKKILRSLINKLKGHPNGHNHAAQKSIVSVNGLSGVQNRGNTLRKRMVESCRQPGESGV